MICWKQSTYMVFLEKFDEIVSKDSRRLTSKATFVLGYNSSFNFFEYRIVESIYGTVSLNFIEFATVGHSRQISSSVSWRCQHRSKVLLYSFSIYSFYASRSCNRQSLQKLSGPYDLLYYSIVSSLYSLWNVKVLIIYY